MKVAIWVQIESIFLKTSRQCLTRQVKTYISLPLFIHVVTGPFYAIFCPDTTRKYAYWMISCSDRAFFASFSTGHDTPNWVWRSFTSFRMTEKRARWQGDGLGWQRNVQDDRKEFRMTWKPFMVTWKPFRITGKHSGWQGSGGWGRETWPVNIADNQNT